MEGYGRVGGLEHWVQVSEGLEHFKPSYSELKAT